MRFIDCTSDVCSSDLKSFVDVSLRIGRGRSEEAKAATGKALWEALRAHCATLFETPYFALSLELREIDPALSWKENGIKPRLQEARDRKSPRPNSSH